MIQDSHWNVRAAACKVAANFKEQQFLPILLAGINDNDALVRFETLKALKYWYLNDLIDKPIVENLLKDDISYIRQEAFEIVLEGKPAQKILLTEAIKDKDPRIRVWAIRQK